MQEVRYNYRRRATDVDIFVREREKLKNGILMALDIS